MLTYIEASIGTKDVMVATRDGNYTTEIYYVPIDPDKSSTKNLIDAISYVMRRVDA